MVQDSQTFLNSAGLCNKADMRGCARGAKRPGTRLKRQNVLQLHKQMRKFPIQVYGIGQMGTVLACQAFSTGRVMR